MQDGHAALGDGADEPSAPSISPVFRPALTSSSSSSFGFIARLLASSRRLRTGSVSDAAGRSANAAARRTQDARGRVLRRGALACAPANSAPAVTFSSTVIRGNGCTIWKVRARPRRAASNGRWPVTSSPLNRTLPAVRREHAGDQVDERRLAGAVRADQADDLALLQLEGDVVRRRERRRNACSALLDLEERPLMRALFRASGAASAAPRCSASSGCAAGRPAGRRSARTMTMPSIAWL